MGRAESCTGNGGNPDQGDCRLRIAELPKAQGSPACGREIANLKAGIAEAQSRLRRISGAFLNWSGKVERLSFDVPTLPLFIHERLSTKAIIETLKGHKSDKQEDFFRELWGDGLRGRAVGAALDYH